MQVGSQSILVLQDMYCYCIGYFSSRCCEKNILHDHTTQLNFFILTSRDVSADIHLWNTFLGIYETDIIISRNIPSIKRDSMKDPNILSTESASLHSQLLLVFLTSLYVLE